MGGHPASFLVHDNPRRQNTDNDATGDEPLRRLRHSMVDMAAMPARFQRKDDEFRRSEATNAIQW